MKYRPEIDGLRALAVLPVILFHAGSTVFSGGYVGVDVFFVISGYLITSLIITDIESGRFTMAQFYERRARRILPALFVVMLATIPFGWLWMLPSQFKDLFEGITAVTLFASNILFWKSTDYFAASAELNPLLHTWSLAVEEQYYLFFPILLLVIWRFRLRSAVTILAALALASLALAQWGIYSEPRATFFLLPTRLWELLVGCLVAVGLHSSQADSKPSTADSERPWVGEIGSAIGVGLLISSIVIFDARTPFPSFWALLPTVGTALVIVFASPRNLTGRVLRSRALVGIGLISYSAYLWHQPMFAFARLRSPTEPEPKLMLLLGVMSIGLAYLTWKYVESPFRNRALVSRRSIFVSAGSGMAILLLVGFSGIALGGLSSRVSHAGRTLADLDLDGRLKPSKGFGLNCSPTNAAACSTSRQPEILLWGDSLAMHLYPALVASRPDIRLVQMTKTVCGPVLGIAPIREGQGRAWSRDCIAFNDAVLGWLRVNRNIRYVVLGSPFELYFDGGARIQTRTGIEDGTSQVALNSFLETLQVLRSIGVNPVVVAPPPINGENIGLCLARAEMFGFDRSRCDISVSDYEKRHAELRRFLANVGAKYRVIDVADLLCDVDKCHASVDGIFIYRDARHYSTEGAEYVGTKLNLYQQITAN